MRTVEGDGTTELVIRKAGVEEADLFIGCSPREEANLVGAMLVKRLSGAQTIVRTTAPPTSTPGASATSTSTSWSRPSSRPPTRSPRTLGLPAARQTDIFAEGKVQIVEFDVPPDAPHNDLIGRTLRSAEMPADSKVAGDHPRRAR